MDTNQIADGLIQYLMLVALLTFHEFAHAWTAWKCGDDTARLQGRLSINPMVHIDPIGTVLLPLLMIFLPANLGSFLIGWAKPVPFLSQNLNHPKRDEVLIAMAGPAMNLILAVVLIGIARVCFHSAEVASLFENAAYLSLRLFFFNLIPIPPLDGSHVLRNVTNMSYEAYANFSRFGFVILIVLLQIPGFRLVLESLVSVTFNLLARMFGM